MAVGEGIMSFWPSPEIAVESSGFMILRPFTPQASTGSTTVFRTCILSLGHSRFAFRNTFGSQLYFIMTPASVSCGFTVCM